MHKNSIIDWSLIVGIGIAWGASFMFTKVGAPAVGPITLVFYRLLIASLVLAPIFIRKKHLINLKNDWSAILFLSFFNASIPFFLFSEAALDLNAGTMSVLNGTTPLFSFVISLVWLKLSSNWIQLTGILIGILGLIIFIGYESLEFALLPIIFCLIASFFYAFSSNFIFKIKDIDSSYLATIILVVATFFVFPLIFLEEGINLNHSANVLTSIGLLGSLCTGLAYMGFVVLIKRAGPVRASTVVLIVPLTGMMWANIFLEEVITAPMLGGCFLILLGVGLVNFFQEELEP